MDQKRRGYLLQLLPGAFRDLTVSSISCVAAMTWYLIVALPRLHPFLWLMRIPQAGRPRTDGPLNPCKKDNVRNDL